jgi:hypothetical protein
MTNLLDSFTKKELKPQTILEIGTQLLPPEDVIQMRLKIAAMYRDNQMDDIVDLDGDGDTSNESRTTALEWYTKALSDLGTSDTTDRVLAKGVCYYNILDLYKNFIYEDAAGKAIVDNMIKYLSKFNSFDQRLLITLASHFVQQYNSSKSERDLQELQKFAKKCFANILKENTKLNIGDYLMKSNDLVSAEKYWSSIAEELECDITGQILSLVQDSDATFSQILNTIKQPENDTSKLCEQWINASEITGDYYMLAATTDQISDIECFRQAKIMYEMAVHLLKQLNADTNRINDVEKKQQKAASLETSSTKSSNE